MAGCSAASAWVRAPRRRWSPSSSTIYGWHAVFYVSAVIGLVIAAFWYWVARDTPARASQRHGRRKWRTSRPACRSRWKARCRRCRGGKIFTSIDVWGTTLAYVAFGYVAFIFHTWFFIYLKDGRGFDLKSSALLGMLALHRHDHLLPAGRRDQRLAGQALGPVCRPQPVRRLHPVPDRHLPDHRQPCRRTPPWRCWCWRAARARCIWARRPIGRWRADFGGPYTGVDLRPGQHGRPDRRRGHRLADALVRARCMAGNMAFYVAAGVSFVCIFPWFFVNPNRRLHVPEQVTA